MLDLVEQLATTTPTGLAGSIVRTLGTAAAVADFPAPVGAVVAIQRQSGPPIRGEVVGFRDDLTLVYPLGDLTGVRRGDPVRLVRTLPWLRVGEGLLGRVVDAHGKAIDGRHPPVLEQRSLVDRAGPPATTRPRIRTALSTGIRAIDALLTCGCGQRMGIFAGSGVGKSVALGMMARSTSADVCVVSLIGERGREVNDFLERDLGSYGLAKSVVVVATSDEPAVVRLRAAFTATTIAEYFRDQGRDVLLLMDSITRFAQAQREVGLVAGEPPATRGYPPSVFALLPKLIERAGRTETGSITAFYSVLVEADDPNEPIGDCVRGLLDGHTWLSRKLASRGHYPAIDILGSLSRLMTDLVDDRHLAAATLVRQLLSVYRDHEDLISIGAYRPGSNPSVDLAIEMLGPIDDFLQQPIDGGSSLESARRELLQLADRAAARREVLIRKTKKSGS